MPIYTYQCEECGVRFDARQKFSDDPIEECPECSGHTHRVPQPVGIVFKGSGWYAKDSKGKNTLASPGKRDGEAESKKESSDSKSDSSSSTSGSSDSKPSSSDAKKSDD